MTRPSCGAEVRVLETRTLRIGLRRRRACLRRECGSKFTTVEVRVPEDYTHHDGEVIVVSRVRAAALRAAARDLDELLGAVRQ